MSVKNAWKVLFVYFFIFASVNVKKECCHFPLKKCLNYEKKRKQKLISKTEHFIQMSTKLFVDKGFFIYVEILDFKWLYLKQKRYKMREKTVIDAY